MTERALWVAKTGLDAQQTRMAVISNNLANVNTTGFKKDRAMFEDLMYQNIRQVGGQTTQNTNRQRDVAGNRCQNGFNRKSAYPGQYSTNRKFAGCGYQWPWVLANSDAEWRYQLHPGWFIKTGFNGATGYFKRLDLESCDYRASRCAQRHYRPRRYGIRFTTRKRHAPTVGANSDG